jgi:hypothetical protein
MLQWNQVPKRGEYDGRAFDRSGSKNHGGETSHYMIELNPPQIVRVRPYE